MFFLNRFFLVCFCLSSIAFGSEQKRLFIVPTSWVADRLNDPTLVLLHVGIREQYDAGHIPGAVFVSRSEISLPHGEGAVVLEMPSVSTLDSVFESKGVSDNSWVVVYFGEDWISPTARVWLTLDYLGFGERSMILDGGMPKWVSEGRPITAEEPMKRTGSFTPRLKDDVLVDVNWIAGNLRSPDITLVDARTPDYYAGEEAGNAMRPGHLPGARNLPFSEMVDEQLLFKSSEGLRELFSKEGVTGSGLAVTYCHIGQQASLVYFVARYVGYEARMYDGSMNEWSRDPKRPLVIGNHPH